MRIHAGADVQKKEDIHGQVFTAKTPDGLRLAFFSEHKVVGVKARDSAVVGIGYARGH